ncbi:MAG: NAD(P)/FAD-dependent oxidoreductase, partial [Alphaproteobacteria bacterium]|nr:NAD(P)/FAD-dependent oxidoreductase [Alphaproteobacteria bacterium]
MPAIIDEVGSVSLFQRTAQWIMPMANPEYGAEERERFRTLPESMDALYDHFTERWAGSFAKAVVGDRDQMAAIADACEANLEDNVHDAALKAQLTPDYQVACKRLIVSDSFYPAIQKPNAHLVTASITGIEPEGVRTDDGTLHDLDVLVLATGFDGHRFMRPINVVGEGGVTVDDAWAEANEAYRSVAIPGFPNLFMLAGPNSPIGNFSLIQIAEMQLAYVMQLIDQVRSGKAKAIAPKREACDRFNAAIRDAMKTTVWVSGCKSWYL